MNTQQGRSAISPWLREQLARRDAQRALMVGDLAEVLDFADAVDAIVLVGGEAQRPGCVRVAFRAAEQVGGKGTGPRTHELFSCARSDR